MHEYSLKIRERHLDTFGHVNNATYLEIYEEARWEILNSYGLGIDFIKKNAIGPVVLEINIKYKKELVLGENITVKTRSLGPLNHLVSQLEQIIHNEKGDVSSLMLVSIGVFKTQERKLIPPPQEWQQIFHKEA